MLGRQLPSTARRLAGTACVAILASGVAFAAWAVQPRHNAEPGAKEDVGSVSTPPPKYPGYAFEHNLEGLVVLRVDVAADGSVAGAVVERAEPKGVFEQAALDAVQAWKFNPAIKDGKPVAGKVRVPIEFKLDSKEGADAGPMKVPARTAPDPAAYDWVRVDMAAMDLKEIRCDVMKGNIASDVIYCGKLRQ